MSATVVIIIAVVVHLTLRYIWLNRNFQNTLFVHYADSNETSIYNTMQNFIGN